MALLPQVEIGLRDKVPLPSGPFLSMSFLFWKSCSCESCGRKNQSNTFCTCIYLLGIPCGRFSFQHLA